MKNQITICYFGIYDPALGRNRIYLKGLQENGVKIIECRDLSRGPVKFIKLFLKHWKIRRDYDYLIVGYPGHAVVWLAKLISRKPVIFDALCSLYEGVVLSRGQLGFWGLKSLYIRAVDLLAVRTCDLCLLETRAQRDYFEKRFGPSDKYKVVYTGASDDVFYQDPAIKKREKFTVVFRGKFLPEAGVRHVIEAAKILAEADVDFLVIGNGWLEASIKEQIKEAKLQNLELISQNLLFSELREKMLSCHVSLGQFENHERLERTIPHKCFETLVMGLPYVTAKTPPVVEILKNEESVLFVNQADPGDLAQKILLLKNSPELAAAIGQNGRRLFEEKFTPKILAKEIISLL